MHTHTYLFCTPPSPPPLSAMPERRRSSLAARFATPAGHGGPTINVEVSVTTLSLGCGIKDGVGGVVVVSVVERGEAERLGVKIGDLIHTVNKKQTRPRTHLKTKRHSLCARAAAEREREMRETVMRETHGLG